MRTLSCVGPCSYVLLVTLCVVSFGQCDTEILIPRDASDALQLYERFAYSDNFYQTQIVISWISQHFVDVLRHPDLGRLDDLLLNRLLSQPWPVDEIEVFRAIRRLIETDNNKLIDESFNGSLPLSMNQKQGSAPTEWRQHHSKSILMSSLYLGSLTPSQINDEVEPSGLIDCDVITDILVRRLEHNLFPGVQRTDPSVGRFLPDENVIRGDLQAEIVNTSWTTPYEFSADCKDSNPLVPPKNITFNDKDQPCFVRLDSATPQNLTLQLGASTFINYIRIHTLSSQRCTINVTGSTDLNSWDDLTLFTNAYSTDSARFPPHLVKYLKLDITRCPSFKIHAIEAKFIIP